MMTLRRDLPIVAKLFISHFAYLDSSSISTLWSRFHRFRMVINNVNDEINKTKNFKPFGIQT